MEPKDEPKPTKPDTKPVEPAEKAEPKPEEPKTKTETDPRKAGLFGM